MQPAFNRTHPMATQAGDELVAEYVVRAVPAKMLDPPSVEAVDLPPSLRMVVNAAGRCAGHVCAIHLVWWYASSCSASVITYEAPVRCGMSVQCVPSGAWYPLPGLCSRCGASRWRLSLHHLALVILSWSTLSLTELHELILYTHLHPSTVLVSPQVALHHHRPPARYRTERPVAPVTSSSRGRGRSALVRGCVGAQQRVQHTHVRHMWLQRHHHTCEFWGVGSNEAWGWAAGLHTQPRTSEHEARADGRPHQQLHTRAAGLLGCWAAYTTTHQRARSTR
jgi:hypothetical protein